METFVQRALERWAVADTEDNTTVVGRAAAAEVVAAAWTWLVDGQWFVVHDGVVVSWRDNGPPEWAVYEWLHGQCEDDARWSGVGDRRRLNRALPQRAAVALLTVLGYPRIANITECYGRRVPDIHLCQWLQDLRQLPGWDARDDDPAWLFWRVYVAEYPRASPRTRRQKLRRLNAWLRRHPGHGAPVDEETAPVAADATTTRPVPAAFRDPRFAQVEAYVRLFVALRWTDHETALGLFRSMTVYAARSADRRHARCMATYVRPVYYLCAALTANRSVGTAPLLPVLDTATRQDCVDALAAVARDRGRCIKALYQFTTGRWRGLLPRWAGWVPITGREVGHRPLRRMRERDRFTEEEVDLLRETARADPVDHGLFTFCPPRTKPVCVVLVRLLHTGCRSGAACSLRVDDVCDGGQPRTVGHVEEKGGVRREFFIDDILRDALLGAIACNRGSVYVFPASTGIGRRSETGNDQWLRRLCARCNIHGDHVHVHALRRTTISMLLDAGNPLATVSQWIGHSSTDRTGPHKKMGGPPTK